MGGEKHFGTPELFLLCLTQWRCQGGGNSYKRPRFIFSRCIFTWRMRQETKSTWEHRHIFFDVCGGDANVAYVSSVYLLSLVLHVVSVLFGGEKGGGEHFQHHMVFGMS